MKSFDPSEQERLQNWRALQVELGLIPDETIVPVPEAEAAPPSDELPPPGEPAPAAARDSHPPETTSEVIAAAAEESLGDYPVADSDSAERDVEVGEAPEEVPDEPGDDTAAPEKKRRRRRRRRRKSEASVDEPTNDAATPETETASASLNGEVTPESEPSDVEGDDDEGEVEDDEEEIEPISLPDWNVPTWQELIDSLYRPER
ncbi:MAG: hypothetical protein N2039_15305 [Gemmataceae bacterium]|nr:hypothetical protein [Gemmataceae bacterium]